MLNFDWTDAVSINLLVLRIVGLWPKGYEMFKKDLYFFYAVIITALFVGGHNLSQIINIYYVYDDLEALSATIFIAATNILALFKRYVFVKKLEVIKDLLQTLNTNQFLPKNEGQIQLIQPSLKRWKYMYFSFSAVVYVNVTMWLIAPVLNNEIRNHQLPFEAWYPFDTESGLKYGIAYCYQFICIWYITVANLNLDTIIFAFMMYICTQCEILCDNLRNLKNDGKFGPNLIDNILHHKKILRFAEESNDIFNIIILGQIATSTAALALTMFQLTLVDPSSGDAFSHLFYLMGISSEIFWYCWFGNEIQIKSSKIPGSLYECEWIDQSLSVKKNMLIFSISCRKPIRITAINLFTISLQAFIGILKSAWSYFALLSTVNSKKA